MGKLIREMDWSKTPLGPIESWPQSLRTTVSLCLASNFPISIAWGPQRTQIYNDGYRPICGAKHPHSMGQDFRECWFSAWPAIGEAFERASAGQTSLLVNQRMFLDRNRYLEETFFTFSFSPIRDETGEVGGLFHLVTEMTDQTLAERRLKVLRDLAGCAADAKTVEDACALIAKALAEHELDLPFALLFLFDADGKRAKLAASSGVQPGTAISPDSVDLSQEAPTSWPLAEVARAGRIEEAPDLERRFGSFSCGPYPEPPKTAYALPIILPGLEQTFGALVAGVSSRRAMDDAYRTFYRMLGDGVSNALANTRAYEAHLKLDRARREAEDKLAQASQRLQAHVDNSPLAAVQFDPEFRVTAWSEGAERMFGWSAAEILRKRIKDLRWVHEADAEAVAALCADMLTGQRLRSNHINRNYRKDGSVIECEWYNSVLRDANGKMISLNSQVLDITERKRVEMNLALLAEISHDLARLTSVDEIMRTVGAKIGEYLNLSLCALVEINEAADEAVVTHDWHRDDAPGLVGVYRIEDFVTGEFQEASRVGELFVVCDTSADPRANAGKFAEIKAGSFVSAPLIRNGQWRFLLVVFHSTAHDWRDDEIELIRELTTRIWTQLERVRAQEELRQSEGRYRATFDNAAVGIAHVGFDGRWLRFNDAVCAITGYSREELVTKTFPDITHPDDVDADWAQARRILAGEIPTYSMEKRYIRKDGSIAWVCLTVSLMRDAAGAPRNFISIIEDIGERKLAEEASRESEERFRTITDNTQSCLWMMDAQGRGTFANPSSERVSGFSPEELIGQVLHEKVHHTHPDGTPFPIEECPLDKALPLQESVVGYEDVFVHKDGHFYPVRCAGRPIVVNGEPIGTVIEVQDITEERRAAAERERLLEEERRHARSLQYLNAASVAINAATSVEEVVRLINEEARELTGAR
ncbi:MAG: PAS domain S-box protein, partial [Blastocatellia bacterium]